MLVPEDLCSPGMRGSFFFFSFFFSLAEEEREWVLWCLGVGLSQLLMRDLDTDLYLLCLLLAGVADGDLLLVDVLGEGVLLLGGVLGEGDLLLGGVLAGVLPLGLC